MQLGEDSDSSLDPSLSDSDDEDGGKNLNKYINQFAFSAEWNLFYQLLC